MNVTIRRVIASYLAPVERRLSRLATQAGLILVAIFALVVAIGFFTAAGYRALAGTLGANWALLIVAAIYLVIAAFMLIVALAGGRRAEPVVASRPPVATAIEGLLASGTADDAALLASLRLFGGMKPFELMGLAIVAGFLAGRRKTRK